MKNLGAAIFFAALALALTAPVWRAPKERIIGNITHPGLRGELFHEWDFCTQAREGRLATYYYSHNVSWPEGQDLRKFIGFSLHLFLYLPFLMFHDLVLPYNLLVVITLALNGFCAFLLCRQIAKAYWPALVCGILFTLSPYAFLKLEQGFLQKAILWWLPLFLLALWRFIEAGRRRDAALAGLAWLGALLTYAPYAWYAALAALALFATHWIVRKRSGQAAEGAVLAVRAWPLLAPAVAGVLFLAFLLPSGGTQPPEGFMPTSVADAPIGSVDILHPFRFFPYKGFRTQVESLPLGVSLAVLIFAVAALARRKPGVGMLTAAALVFFVLALGPFPGTDGELLSRLPLPYYFIAMFAPWGKRLGYSIRVLPFLELALLGLAALACSSGKPSKAKTLQPGLAMSLLLLCLGVLEKAWLLPELYPPLVTSAQVSPETAWLHGHAKTVLHLPFNVRGSEPHEYCYISARSGTRMLNPYLDFRSEGFPLPPLPAANPDEMAGYLTMLARSGATHIAIHLEALAMPPRPRPDQPENASAVESYGPADIEIFREWCGEPAYTAPGKLLVYTVPDTAEIARKLAIVRKSSSPTRLEQAIISEARRRGMDQQPDIIRQTKSFEDRLLIERFIEQEICPSITLAEKDLIEYFENHRASFRRDPQIRVFHILLPLPKNPSPAEWSATYARAEALLAEISGTVEHALALAESISRTDPSGARWGDLGYIGPGRLPPVIDEELFAVAKRDELAIFESSEGFHLFRITDARPGRNFTFEKVKEAVREQAERAALARAISRWAQTTLAASGAPQDEMVRLPGGTFMMGSTPEEIDRAVAMAHCFVGRTRKVERAWFEDETMRNVTVAPFEIDRHEVTVAEYRAFLKASGRPAPPAWEQSPPPHDSCPATGVTWEEASAYAAWLGKRLPTAEEWEWAARGAERRFFPWGDAAPDGTRANYADKQLNVPHNDPANDDGFAGLAPVGSFPAGATPQGVMDMAGNAREWTSSQAMGIRDTDHHIWQWENRPEHLRGPEHSPELMYVVKGGSFDSAADDLRCSDMRILPPDTRHESMGFRCVRDAF